VRSLASDSHALPPDTQSGGHAPTTCVATPGDSAQVEKAQSAIDEEDAQRLMKKMLSAKFDFDDFLKQYRAVNKMGALGNVMKMIPGLNAIDDKELQKVERKYDTYEKIIEVRHMRLQPTSTHAAALACCRQRSCMEWPRRPATLKCAAGGMGSGDEDIVWWPCMRATRHTCMQCMTEEERQKPDLLVRSAKRKRQLARDSGRTQAEVNDLLTTFTEMRVRMKSMSKMMAASGGMGAPRPACCACALLQRRALLAVHALLCMRPCFWASPCIELRTQTVQCVLCSAAWHGR
jgi:hypothetical protein